MNPDALPCLDVMDELVKVLASRELDSVAKATLGIQKSGNGWMRSIYRNGEWIN